jgi:hypothetical protein
MRRSLFGKCKRVLTITDNMDYLSLSALDCGGLWITEIYNILHGLHIIDSQWEIMAEQEELVTIY